MTKRDIRRISIDGSSYCFRERSKRCPTFNTAPVAARHASWRVITLLNVQSVTTPSAQNVWMHGIPAGALHCSRDIAMRSVAHRECIRLDDKLLEAVEKADVVETTKQERQRYLRDLKNQVLSMKYVEKNTRACPNCGMGIEKDGGCNHMFCTYCSMHFCYVCGIMNIGYDHFSAKGCVLFDERAISDWERMQREPQRQQVWSNAYALRSVTCACRHREGDNPKGALF